MEEKDPIMERRAREAENSNGTLKSLLVVAIVVAVILAAALAFIWINKNNLVEELEGEKQELTIQMENLRQDYDSISSDYESINRQLDTSKAEVAQLLDRLKKTEATNRSQIRKLMRETETLRRIMRNYIVQIDSLNTLNHKLKKAAASARKDAEQTRRANAELSQQVQDLSGRVAVGSIIKARGIRLVAHNRRDKETSRSSRVKSLLTFLSLVENDLAKKGNITVYVRIKDPSGAVLTNDRMISFDCNGETLVASASRKVDYQGEEVELCIYLNDIESYTKGIYTVEAYTEQALLGTAELMLR